MKTRMMRISSVQIDTVEVAALLLLLQTQGISWLACSMISFCFREPHQLSLSQFTHTLFVLPNMPLGSGGSGRGNRQHDDTPLRSYVQFVRVVVLGGS